MQTVDVVMNHPEQFKITAMAAGYNVAKVEEILAMIDVEYICMVKKRRCFISSRKNILILKLFMVKVDW